MIPQYKFESIPPVFHPQGITTVEGAKNVAQRLMNLYDKDRDGNLNFSEVQPMMQGVYKAMRENYEPKPQDIKGFQDVLDNNGDGLITLSDLEQLAIQYLTQDPMTLIKNFGPRQVVSIPLSQPAPVVYEQKVIVQPMETSKYSQNDQFPIQYSSTVQKRLDVAKRIFAILDKDKNGYITRNEIPELLKLTYRDMGISDYQPTKDDVDAWYLLANPKEPGKITLDEFEQVILNSLKKAGISFT